MIMEDIDSTEIDSVQEVINAQARESKRLSSKPYIDHLDDAVVIDDKTGKPVLLQKKGMRLIIERTASMLEGRPWLDTRSYIITAIDPESGNLRLLDEEQQHSASSNFITGLELGYRFKIPARGPGAPLPKRNKTAVKEKVVDEVKKPASASSKEAERRIYSTRGVIHTRIKGVAYVPQGQTKAADAMRLATVLMGSNLKVKHPTDGWEEVWVPTKEI